MPERTLPVVPDLDQLRHQAKDLLRAIRARDPEGLADLERFHPEKADPVSVKLADAQLVLARSYQAPSWPRLVQCCRLIEAIWNDDPDTVRDLVTRHPNLLRENAGIRNGNWGPPLTYAANVGRDRIIRMLRDLGADDLKTALDRALLQGRIPTARMLHDMLGRPQPAREYLDGAAYTLSASGTELLFELGVQLEDERGNASAPVNVVLETDSRKLEAKHAILEMYAKHGVGLPDTPVMALHRGRLDLLEEHLRRDSSLLERTFSYAEIFPPELGCRQPAPATFNEAFPRTPISGTTLLHVSVEFDELEIAEWLLDRGMHVDAPAAVDEQGFGGHTALFGAVVSYPNFWRNYTKTWAHSRKPDESPFAQLLLDRGANPNGRASLRETGYTHDDILREHRDVTPVQWGEAFQNKLVVSAPAMRLIAGRAAGPANP